MGALARRLGRHRARLAGAAAVALAAAALAGPAEAARTKLAWDVSGGLAPTRAALTVATDRTARAEVEGERATFTLTDREWRRLGERLRAARFRTLAPRYVPDPVVPDGTFDRIRYRGHTVTVATGGDPPRRLQRLLRHIRRLHGRHAPAR